MEKKEKKQMKNTKKDKTIKTTEKQILTSNQATIQLEIIQKLTPLSKKLVNKKAREYINSNLGSIFNEHEIRAMAEDLVLDIANKVLDHSVDEKGMYNYLRSSFKNKCIDLKNAHCHTIKRGSEITIENNNIHDIQMDGSEINNPENILYLKNELFAIQNLLKKFDTDKAPYSEIIRLLLEDYDSKEIQTILSMKASTLDRNKKKAFSILNNYFKDKDLTYLDFLPENIKSTIIEKSTSPYKKEYTVLKDISYSLKNLPTELKLSMKENHNFLAYIQIFIVEKDQLNGKYVSTKFLFDSFLAESQESIDNYLQKINDNSHLYIENFISQKEKNAA